ncbi:hypothetical protein Kpol_520p17 [Vanderwaltozyma polyspora DSM 70294]|uniref:Protein kinase C-like 1 n=1 Tax=Vanderwaltozyma polyspora (strain ATCC 22028 / DSM 70294 / BCRC 21397 / CBS 2163 / NBRC 10782 / NRRL Y-8283 / UCD 57-17) TaxID=436907 RepID=A7TMA2_VANPO|nr:uncharacterized protein Kpol_520p17 [Vanderwaltozyma polyspora DSM 70294]EDO16596.1 hypothetical protein Kpol_520p17 [Vanderwaltozyma polyspora DSM 70294]
MYDKVQQSILKKIERENNIILGSSNLKKKTDNPMVIQKCNTNIREARQNIEYLEEQLRKLQLNSIQKSQSNNESSQNNEYGQLTTKSPDEHIFSRLDLVKYDCPSMSQRIQYLLQQLEFKLQVERQYQEANAKLTKLYQIDGDTRSSSAAEGGAMESKSRIQLLTKALKKYQAINVDLDQFRNQDSDAMNNTQPKFRRKQLSGTLLIGISTVRDVDHIQSPMFSRKPESYIVIKIDDVIKARSKASRNDRWSEEFHIPVDKGNEVEIIVYDKVNDSTVPVAVMWFLLADVAEEIRKKKVGQTSGQQGWVNASRVMSTSPATQLNDTGYMSNSTPTARGIEAGMNPGPVINSPDSLSSNNAITCNSWFILEPTGQILLTLGFDKSTAPQKTNLVGGLHRHGAIINRKEEVFEQHGHHFVQKSFYNIMCCAYCGDFLRYSGFQCQDCKFLCHKKCYTDVVTKCIAKSTVESDSDEAKLNHHIPHRFEPAPNRGTKWCCHCGYILPWGRQKVRRCTECGIMCHSQCAHLVPDFCGMSMEMANTILKTIQDTKRNQEKRRKIPPSLKTDKSSSSTSFAELSGRPTPISRNNTDFQQSYPIQQLPFETQQKGYRSKSERIEEIYSPTVTHPNKSLPEERVSRHEDLSNIIEKNDVYNSFTADAGINISPGKESNRVFENDVQVEIPEERYFNEEIEDDSTDVKLQEENALWKEERSHLEEELRESSKRYSVMNIPEPTEESFIPEEYIPEAQIDIEISNEEPSVLVEKTISKQSSVNPFREMNKDTFVKEQEVTVESITQELKSISNTPVRNSVHGSPQKSHTSGKHRKKSPKRRKVSLDDFILMKVLGKGNFGKVLLSKSKNTGRICAIKVLKKDHIIQNHDIESARAEKKVFLLATKAKHPFLTNLYCSFQTENRIYFAMEFIGGGDLMWHVQNQRLSVRRAKFYSAEVLLALKYFHDNGVIYRDLKLENILLTPEGHIKIADYGLCKDDMWYGNRTSTFCGTPEFMAPEILKEQEYTKAVDWWAFGVLLYQMLLCQSPFSGDDEDEVFNAILTDEPLYPIDMAGDIVQIFQGLLTKDPEKRLGAGPRDALEVMGEPFFRNINFDDVLNLRVQPPYIPKISSPEDTSYFEQEFTSAPPTLTPLPSVLTTNQQEEFRGFSFMPEDLEL